MHCHILLPSSGPVLNYYLWFIFSITHALSLSVCLSLSLSLSLTHTHTHTHKSIINYILLYCNIAPLHLVTRWSARLVNHGSTPFWQERDRTYEEDVWPIREFFSWRPVIFRADRRVCGRLAAELWAVCVVWSGGSDSGAVWSVWSRWGVCVVGDICGSDSLLKSGPRKRSRLGGLKRTHCCVIRCMWVTRSKADRIWGKE